MKIKQSIFIILAIYLIGVVFIAFSFDLDVSNNVDIISINQVSKTIEENWPDIEKGSYGSSNQEFVVLDNNEKVLFSTKAGLVSSVNDAIKNRESIVDINVNGKTVGKVIFENNYEQIIKSNIGELLVIIVLTFTAIAIFAIIYIVYLNRAVFKPFKRLEAFAHNVAGGNLDIPLNMDKQNIFGAFSESFDIMREELATAKRNEYLANRSKKELVASLSHDIKTPVSSIKAISEMLLLLATDEKEKARLNTIYFKAEQINLLISDMFQATLEELEELKVEVKDENSTVLEDIIKNVNYFNKITYKQIPECVINVDVTRLQQVFDNVLSNSYKYADTPINIKCIIQNGFMEVDIIDKGKGVKPEELPLLFNKFKRGSNSEGKSGSGLGLYISKYLMQKMNGDISCENLPSGFKVTLIIRLS